MYSFFKKMQNDLNTDEYQAQNPWAVKNERTLRGHNFMNYGGIE